jgi:hypothetical protein
MIDGQTSGAKFVPQGTLKSFLIGIVLTTSVALISQWMVCCLVQDERLDILIIGNSGGTLYDELAIAHD